MQLHPTRNAVALTAAGIVVVGVGLVSNQAAIVAWGGALFLGLQLARAVTLLGVTQIRTAGFEMLWREERRVARLGHGETLSLHAEVRNRDNRAARYVHLRALCSPHLHVHLEPDFGEVPAGGRLDVAVSVQASRVGKHGIFGLSLEVQGGPGLYEVPLTFSNPFGIEVMPRAYSLQARSPVGGRSRLRAEGGKASRRPLGSTDLRELRDYQSGDAFKVIAWKASARRGKLVVREYELEERDVVWFILDASVELWAGVSGHAPLDLAIDWVAELCARHLQQGDRVGLGIVGARRLAWLAPKAGSVQLAAILEALSFGASTHDADRSTLDESDCAARVVEHLRPMVADSTALGDLGRLDALVESALAAKARAPFPDENPQGRSNNDRALRAYLAAFGIDSPPRLEPDRPRTDAALLDALREATHHSSKPTRVTICSPVPRTEQRPLLFRGLRQLRRRRTRLSWLDLPLSTGLVTDESQTAAAVRYALELRHRAETLLGSRELRSLGIRTESMPGHRRITMQHASTSTRQTPDARVGQENSDDRTSLHGGSDSTAL